MKSFIVLALVAAVALAAPPTFNGDEKLAEIVNYVNDVGPESFKSGFATSNNINGEAQGQLKNAGSENEAFVHSGSYSYVAPDGQTISVTYTADETGFHPQGAHLPV